MGWHGLAGASPAQAANPVTLPSPAGTWLEGVNPRVNRRGLALTIISQAARRPGRTTVPNAYRTLRSGCAPRRKHRRRRTKRLLLSRPVATPLEDTQARPRPSQQLVPFFVRDPATGRVTAQRIDIGIVNMTRNMAGVAALTALAVLASAVSGLDLTGTASAAGLPTLDRMPLGAASDAGAAATMRHLLGEKDHKYRQHEEVILHANKVQWCT